MLRSPLHLLLSLHRLLHRSKLRHKSSHILFRPIATFYFSKIPTNAAIATEVVLNKPIPALGQQPQQLIRLLQRRSTLSTSTARRLLIYRRNTSCCVQSRTMVTSNSTTTTTNQLVNVLSPNHFFTPVRPPILGVHGGGTLPPPPPISFRSYNTKPSWSQQRSITTSSICSDNDIEDVDDDDYIGSNRFHCIHSSSSLQGGKQQRYQPPHSRGMADVMDQSDNNNNKKMDHHHPGLVHRGQPPKKSQQQQQQQEQSQPLLGPVGMLRHDDLSLQTIQKQRRCDTQDYDEQKQQWYVAIPMDLSSLLLQASSSTSSSTLPNTASNIFFMENSTSILDPTWLNSFHQWGTLIREHLAKVMMFLQLVGLEAQRYIIKHRNHQSNTAFKMRMIHGCSELRLYVPYQHFAPSPMTDTTIAQWIYQLMPSPPSFQVKCTQEPADDEIPPHGLEIPATNNIGSTSTTTILGTASSSYESIHPNNTIDDDDEEDDDLVIIPSLHGEQRAIFDPEDETSWHVGPRYFEGIHSFLNHVDSMIDSSPAFASNGSTTTQRRFSA
ncbi:uncharacterized protein BX664DRAFT_333112 [Halteromyces radiatus]|uniref:uncharacterized protein n=1 Tax=Halteromyces radiatus TaxID=101107 RepID=UPI00221EBA79|nr:uncharacterized protein BX664DRAFT_333112 [Halteromyces radiatus]KAI8089478.1 hypothetical protein BX664DRAFT_333112 [Halteromyces radiatus]